MNKIVFIFKRLFLAFAILSCCLVSSGCINLKIADEYTINSDMSAEHSFEYLVGNNLYMFEEQIDDSIYEHLEDAGYTDITNVRDENYFGMKGSQYINSFNFDNVKQNDYVQITDNSKDYYIFKYINIDANVNLDEILNTEDADGMVSLNEYKLTINLPIPFVKTNAQKMSDDNKSATWLFYPNNDNFMHFEVVMPNQKNIKITLIGLAGVVGLIILIKLLQLACGNNKKSSSEQKNITEKCPNCSTPINGQEEFCGNCGTKLYKFCPQCGHKNLTNADFCEECGNKLD